MDHAPFLTGDVPSIGGALRVAPDDFVVEEIPAYEPSGDGEHLYVTFEKRGLTTPQAVRAIAQALGSDPREAGWAGMKDKHGVTVQTASIARADAARALALALPGIVVRAAKRHRNKLKPGHLHGNRFRITVRGCDPGALERARAVRAVLLARGVPNYYGEQRFGRDGDNAEQARAWLAGRASAPRDRVVRRMLVSALQSEVFNRYLGRRVADGLLDRYVDGDLAVRHPAGRPFAIEPAEAQGEYDARRCSATGPMFGASMRAPERDALERERAVLGEAGVTLEQLARAGDLAEGTRRAVRMCLDEIGIVAPANEPGLAGGVGVALSLEFALPAGGYATAVLREFRKTDDEGLPSERPSGIEPPQAAATRDDGSEEQVEEHARSR